MAAAAGTEQQIRSGNRRQCGIRHSLDRQKEEKSAQKQKKWILASYLNPENLDLGHGLHSPEYPCGLFFVSGFAVQQNRNA